MTRIESQVDKMKDAFIIYCASKLSHDENVQKMLSDLEYLKSKLMLELTHDTRKLDYRNNKHK
jgi:hypothetical protein